MKSNLSVLDQYRNGVTVSVRQLFLFILMELSDAVNKEFKNQKEFVVFYNKLVKILNDGNRDVISFLESTLLSMDMDFNCSSNSAAILRNGLAALFNIRYQILASSFDNSVVTCGNFSGANSNICSCINESILEFQRIGHFIEVLGPMTTVGVFQELGIVDPVVHKLKLDIVYMFNKQNIDRSILSEELELSEEIVNAMFKGNVSGIPLEKLITVSSKFGINIDGFSYVGGNSL